MAGDGSVTVQAQTLTRRRRQHELERQLQENPFLTDEELAALFQVSVQTIRLDRMTLGIPEVRERTREMAQRSYEAVKSIASREIVGDLVDLDLGRSAISILNTTDEMVFEKTQIVRSHFLFAQADSLALAVIDADVAVTGLVNVKYKRIVEAGERLVAKAEVMRRKGRDKFVVLVVTRVRDETVFRAKFVVFVLSKEGAS